MMAMTLPTNRWWDPENWTLPSQLVEDRRLIEATRLSFQLTGVDGHGAEHLWFRTRRAATLLELALDQARLEIESSRIWEVVALTYESLGLLNTANQDYQWLLASLAWQLANAPSIAGLLAGHLLSHESFRTRDIIEKMALAFSRRDFDLLRGLSEAALDVGSALQAKVQQTKDWQDALEAGMLLSAGTVMRELARYVNFNDAKLPDLTRLEDFLRLALAAGDSRRFRVGRMLAKSLLRFSGASGRILIDQVPDLHESAKSQIHKHLNRYPELWPSQQEAIKKGLLDSSKRHFVLATPTSSGKTLCAELVIIQQLAERPDAVCFYVVPTRALVSEKSQELQHKLGPFDIRVRAATSALQQDEIEAEILSEAQVIVCTPEKLDLLIRHEDQSLSQGILFVIDETQMIADDDRGLGLEFVVIKLLVLKPGARILFLSAMLSNCEDFGRWLSEQANISFSDWHPTRQKFGEVSFRKIKPRGAGLELKLYDATGDFDELMIPLRIYSRQPKTLLEKITWAVEVFRAKGPVLVFCMTKPRCEEIAAALVEFLRSQNLNMSVSDEVENLKRKIQREIATDFLLDEALSFRVAYHHADLPPRIRVDLEQLIADNDVDVVVSTTTLAEGVNLPISTVLFEDWMTHPDARQGEKPAPLDISKFRNISGRAGRAGKETEGLAIFLEPERENKMIKLPAETEKTPREYFIRQEYPAIQSRFLEIVNNYEVPTDAALDEAWEHGDLLWRKELQRALRQFGIAVLHAMEVLKLSDDVIIDQVIDRSLLAVQAPEKKDAAKAWFGTWVRFYRRVNLPKEELRPIAMQVGLPLRAIQRLYARATQRPELLEGFKRMNANNLQVSEEQILRATEMVAEIEELDWRPKEAPHAELLAGWLRGETIAQLQKIYAPYLAERTRHLEHTCNYTTQQLSNQGSWGMYALARILSLILSEEEAANILKRLPLFAYFGVDTTPAALLCLIGIERIDAIRLGAAFLANDRQDASIYELKAWAHDLGMQNVTSILSGAERREIDRETLKILGFI